MTHLVVLFPTPIPPSGRFECGERPCFGNLKRHELSVWGPIGALHADCGSLMGNSGALPRHGHGLVDSASSGPAGTDSTLLKELMDACESASRRGECSVCISEHLLLAAATHMFLAVGQEGTKALLKHALRDVKNGDFAKMLEGEGFIEPIPRS